MKRVVLFVEGSSGQLEEWLADSRIDIAVLYRYGASLPEHEQLASVRARISHVDRTFDALTVRVRRRPLLTLPTQSE
jgi:hypothetical protein